MQKETPAHPSLFSRILSKVSNSTIAVAFLMGRKADEKPKILIAAFAGAVAGVALIYFAALLRLWDAPMLARASAGIFAASLVTGVVYGWIGYATAKR